MKTVYVGTTKGLFVFRPESSAKAEVQFEGKSVFQSGLLMNAFGHRPSPNGQDPSYSRLLTVVRIGNNTQSVSPSPKTLRPHLRRSGRSRKDPQKRYFSELNRLRCLNPRTTELRGSSARAFGTTHIENIGHPDSEGNVFTRYFPWMRIIG